jgi:hypothetical protein
VCAQRAAEARVGVSPTGPMADALPSDSTPRAAPDPRPPYSRQEAFRYAHTGLGIGLAVDLALYLWLRPDKKQQGDNALGGNGLRLAAFALLATVPAMLGYTGGFIVYESMHGPRPRRAAP